MNFKKFLFLNLCLDSFLLGSFSFLRLRLLRKLSCHNFFLQKEGNNSRSWQLSSSNQPGELNDTLAPFICSDNPTAYFGDFCYLFLLNQLWASLREKKKYSNGVGRIYRAPPIKIQIDLSKTLPRINQHPTIKLN